MSRADDPHPDLLPEPGQAAELEPAPAQPCDVCEEPVAAGARVEVLLEGGPVWRHPAHHPPPA